MDASFASKQNISDDEDSEESGWTSYFDDFFDKQEQERNSGGWIHDDHSYLVSDAASFVVDQKKFSKPAQLIPSTSTLTKLSKTLDLKKRNKENLYDDSLEDTASSPVHSPKIMQVERGIPNLHLDGRSDEKTGGMAMEGDENDCRGLRKPGPCLFSMSMAYFG